MYMESTKASDAFDIALCGNMRGPFSPVAHHPNGQRGAGSTPTAVSRTMRINLALLTVALTTAPAFAQGFYEPPLALDINPNFSMPRDIETLDFKQEALFENCVDERDRLIHAETFSSIDNPDVQREVLATRKARAVSECRLNFPKRRVTTSEPLHFNLIDLT